MEQPKNNTELARVTDKPEKPKQKKKSRFNNKNQSQMELSAMLDRRVGSVYQLMKDGMKPVDVKQMLQEKLGIGYHYSEKLVNEATILLGQEVERDPDILIALHSKRYDDVYNKAKDLYKQWIKFPQEREDFANNAYIINEYKSVLQALRQKERLYDLHSKEVKDIISTIYYRERGGGADKKSAEDYFNEQFDFKKLPVEKLERIVSILEKGLPQKEEFKVSAPDGSREVITKTPITEDDERSKEIKGNPIAEYTIQKKVSVTQAAKDLNAVKEKLRLSLTRKIEETYKKQDEKTRENKNRNLNVNDNENIYTASDSTDSTDSNNT